MRGSFLIKFRLEKALTQGPLSRGRERTLGTRLRLELLMKIKSKTCRLVLVSTFSFPFKALLREQETRHAIEDAEIKGLELQAQKEMLQQVSIQALCGFPYRSFGAKEVIPWGHGLPHRTSLVCRAFPDCQRCRSVKPIPDPAALSLCTPVRHSKKCYPRTP